MTDLRWRALVTCQLVWEDEDRVRHRLAEEGIEVDVPRYQGQQMGEAELLQFLGGYDGILAGDDHLTRRVLESASPRLRVISKWGIGVDAIDLEAAEELGVSVFNTPGVFGDELADYAMGFIHMLARRQHEVNARVREGDWQKVRGVSLAGKTVGIVGLGSSGRALARRAVAAKMHVVGHDIEDFDGIRDVEAVALDELLSRADIVSLHLPATLETRQFIDSDTLAKMKRGTWLVNTSRGSLVDEEALVEALESGRVGGAALDVFESEPVSADNPLLEFDNVVVGSHNGSNTAEAVERTTWLAVDNLIAGLSAEGGS